MTYTEVLDYMSKQATAFAALPAAQRQIMLSMKRRTLRNKQQRIDNIRNKERSLNDFASGKSTAIGAQQPNTYANRNGYQDLNGALGKTLKRGDQSSWSSKDPVGSNVVQTPVKTKDGKQLATIVAGTNSNGKPVYVQSGNFAISKTGPSKDQFLKTVPLARNVFKNSSSFGTPAGKNMVGRKDPNTGEIKMEKIKEKKPGIRYLVKSKEGGDFWVNETAEHMARLRTTNAAIAAQQKAEAMGLKLSTAKPLAGKLMDNGLTVTDAATGKVLSATEAANRFAARQREQDSQWLRNNVPVYNALQKDRGVNWSWEDLVASAGRSLQNARQIQADRAASGLGADPRANKIIETAGRTAYPGNVSSVSLALYNWTNGAYDMLPAMYNASEGSFGMSPAQRVAKQTVSETI